MDKGGVSSSGWILIEGAQDLLGAPIVSRLLDAQPCEANGYLRFPALLAGFYGADGGRGMALRVGRGVFHRMLKRHGASSGLTSIEFHLLTPRARFQRGLQTLVGLCRAEFNLESVVTADGESWLWRTDCTQVQEGIEADGTFCYLIAGLLQEFMLWAGGGRFYRVSALECRAAGGQQCVFRIDPKPLD